MAPLFTLILLTWTWTFLPRAQGVMTSNCTCDTVGGVVTSADCSGLGWTEVPKELPWTMLRLNMSGNLLVSLPSFSFVEYSALESLDLSGNSIKNLTHDSFTGLLRLRWLSLRSNLLPYFPRTFPDQVFKDLSRLTYLDLQNQTFVVSPAMTYPDVAVSCLRSLRTLRMDGLANNVHLGPGFAGLRQLEELDMNDESGHCAFTELPERFFASINTSRPLVLNLSSCAVRRIHDKAFSFLPTLHSLDLYGCRHLTLPAFMEASKSLRWTKVKALNISYTHHGVNQKIEAEYFQYLGYTWLEHVKVDGVDAYDIDIRAIFNLPTSLKYLSFCDNKLINATFLYGFFLMPHMTTVEISRQNHFTSAFSQAGSRDASNLQKQATGKEGDAVRVFEIPDKGKRFEESDKSKIFEEPDKSKIFEGPDKAKIFEGPDKAKIFEGPDKAKIFEGPDKAKIFEGPDKAKIFEGPDKAKIFEGPDKAKLHSSKSERGDPGGSAAVFPSASVAAKPAHSLSTRVSGSSEQRTRHTADAAEMLHKHNETEIENLPADISLGHPQGTEEDADNSNPTQGTVLSQGTSGTHRKPLFRDQNQAPSPQSEGAVQAAQGLVADPSICQDWRLRRREEERVYRFLRGLKAFLHKHHLWTAGRSGKTSSRAEPATVDDVVPRRLMLEVTKSVSDSQAGERNSTPLTGFSDSYVPLPPTIKFVYANDIKLGYILPQFQFFNNSVEVLELSNNRLPCFVGPWTGLNKLRLFDLSRNFAVYLDPDFFQGMPNLTHLFLQSNFLGASFSKDFEGRSLSHLRNLEVLDLSDNYIKHLSPAAFQAQERLRNLSLARNAISRFRTRIGHMTSLTYLDLSGNNFAHLHRQLREDLEEISQRSHNLTVDLFQNELACDCDALDFWFWAIRKTKVRLHRLEEYTCTLNNGSEIGFEDLARELDFIWLQCQGQYLLNIAVGLIVTVVFLLTIFGVLHYKRWRLRYFYYVGLSRYRHPYDSHQRQDDRQAQGIRDVFISFDDEDTKVRLFVQNVLRPELEQRGLTYFISEIDFPGHPIKDIIPHVVLGARKTLALFSSNFFPSYERELELNMAVYHEERIHQQVIVPVLLEKVDWSLFPPEVMVYLEEHPVAFYRHGDDNFAQLLIAKILAVVRF